jgi:hypothetical protein
LPNYETPLFRRGRIPEGRIFLGGINNYEIALFLHRCSRLHQRLEQVYFHTPLWLQWRPLSGSDDTAERSYAFCRRLSALPTGEDRVRSKNRLWRGIVLEKWIEPLTEAINFLPHFFLGNEVLLDRKSQRYLPD